MDKPKGRHVGPAPTELLLGWLGGRTPPAAYSSDPGLLPQCGPRSTHTTWELGRNAHSQPLAD